MEDWVSRLERNVDQLAKDVGEIKVDFATIKENLRHLPTKGFIVTATSGALALIAAISIFVQWVLSTHPFQ